MHSSTFLFLNLGTPEIMVIMFVVLLLFGGKKLPELARGLGKGIREFKDASEGVKREIHNNINNVNDGIDLNGPSKTTETVQPDPFTPDEEPVVTTDTENPKTAH
ncbi:MAG: twin-arginine translocase TatA/TatE family subunit [Daejeonella sp.]